MEIDSDKIDTSTTPTGGLVFMETEMFSKTGETNSFCS